jgi:hypothetical protein
MDADTLASSAMTVADATHSDRQERTTPDLKKLFQRLALMYLIIQTVSTTRKTATDS